MGDGNETRDRVEVQNNGGRNDALELIRQETFGDKRQQRLGELSTNLKNNSEESYRQGEGDIGQRSEQELMKWLRKSPQAAELRESMQRQGWELVRTGKGSPADKCNMDFILFNHKNGRYFFLDATTNAGTKGDISALHRQGLVEVQSTREGVTDASELAFSNKIKELMKTERGALNLLDQPPPSMRTDLSPEQQKSDIERFCRNLRDRRNSGDNSGLFEEQARSIERKALSHSRATMNEVELSDIQRKEAKTIMEQAARQAMREYLEGKLGSSRRAGSLKVLRDGTVVCEETESKYKIGNVDEHLSNKNLGEAYMGCMQNGSNSKVTERKFSWTKDKAAIEERMLAILEEKLAGGGRQSIESLGKQRRSPIENRAQDIPSVAEAKTDSGEAEGGAAAEKFTVSELEEKILRRLKRHKKEGNEKEVAYWEKQLAELKNPETREKTAELLNERISENRAKRLAGAMKGVGGLAAFFIVADYLDHIYEKTQAHAN